MNEQDNENVNAIRFCVDKEVEDYGYDYTIEDIEFCSGYTYAYVKFSSPSRWGVYVKISKVVKNEDGEYDCVFEVSLGDDYYEVTKWWDWQAKYFWMALLSK
jgi:hypothetical protein